LNNPELADEPADYGRTISYLYFPLGYRFHFNTGHITWESVWSYYLFMSGKVTTMLSEVGYSNDIEGNQNEGKGYSITLAMIVRNWKVELYTRYWHIEDSDVGSALDRNGDINYFDEPENKTHSYGVRLLYIF
jgi:hypothetical protein